MKSSTSATLKQWSPLSLVPLLTNGTTLFPTIAINRNDRRAKTDCRLASSSDHVDRRDTGLLPCARTHSHRLPGRLFRRARRHSGAMHGGGGDERLSVSPQRQYALGL